MAKDYSASLNLPSTTFAMRAELPKREPDMLKGWNEASARDFASLVINEAIKRRNDGYDDDITAIAINIIDLTAA